MSYSITLQGHSSNPHNAQVKEIAEDAWAKLKDIGSAIDSLPTLSGYSSDSTGSITLAAPAQPGGIEGEGDPAAKPAPASETPKEDASA